MRYNIFTIEGKKILKNAKETGSASILNSSNNDISFSVAHIKYSNLDATFSNKKYSFTLNLNNQDGEQGSKNLVKHEDCTLFDQINKVNKINEPDEISLMDSILIVDFGNVFNTLKAKYVGDDNSYIGRQELFETLLSKERTLKASINENETPAWYIDRSTYTFNQEYRYDIQNILKTDDIDGWLKEFENDTLQIHNQYLYELMEEYDINYQHVEWLNSQDYSYFQDDLDNTIYEADYFDEEDSLEDSSSETDITVDSSLNTDLSYVDNDIPELENEEDFNFKDNPSTENDNDQRTNLLELEHKLIQLFNAGITVTLGKKTKHFVPFDKSQSMSRASRITFIDETLVKELNKRLQLDMDFSSNMGYDMSTHISKFLAYRGLYLTTGDKVNFSAEDYAKYFNQDSVIVLKDKDYTKYKDFKYSEFEYSCITNEEISKGAATEAKCKIVNRNEKFNFDNSFDGEGIISCELSDKINALMNYGDSVTSYQIRMPFIKGMLHRVDFHKFLENFATLKGSSDLPEYKVTDAFEVDRNLMKAHIIIPESMFKGIDWVSHWLELTNSSSKNADKSHNPRKQTMSYYFKKFTDYEYGLVIANTNLPYSNRSITELNYQFINTLGLDKEAMHSLTLEHFSYIQDIVSYIKKSRSKAMLNRTENNWLSILLEHPAFMSDPYIKGKLSSLRTSLKNKVASGNFITSGTTRYLSRDLMFFLYWLLNKEDRESFFASHGNEFLDMHHFDLPGNDLSFMDNYDYPLFRNPHLSRNEQFILKYQGNTNTPLRKEYLGHLDGIVQVSINSLCPEALGGADFDGDTVHIYDNDIVRDSVLRNTYNMPKDANYDSTITYERTLPYIKITPLKSTTTKDVFDGIDYTVIKNTFSNKIGLLSNISSILGSYYYNPYNQPGDSTANITLCAECTIYTGLEIDAAKTGSRANLKELLKNNDLIIEEYSDLVNNYKDKFLDPITETMVTHHVSRNKIKLENDQTFIYNPYGNNSKNTSKNITYAYNDKSCSLALIPKSFYECINMNITSKKGSTKYYGFQKTGWDLAYKKGWEDILLKSTNKNIKLSNTNELYKLAQFIAAYKDFLNLVAQVNMSFKFYKTSNAQKDINKILSRQYSNYNKKINAVEQSLNMLSEQFENIEAINKAKKELYDTDWAYLTNEDDKRKVIDSIFDIKGNNDEIYSILCNYNNRGYFLAYLLLNALQSELYITSPRILFERALEKLKNSNKNSNPTTEIQCALTVLRNGSFYKEVFQNLLINFYTVPLLNSDGNFNYHEITLNTSSYARKQFSAYFSRNQETFMKVFYLSTKLEYPRFIWDVIDYKTIEKEAL